MEHNTTLIRELLPLFEIDLRRSAMRLTVVGYLQELRLCCDWLVAHHLKREPVLEDLATKHAMQAWIDHLRDKLKRKPATVGRKAQALRKFLEFLVEEKSLANSVGAKLQVPRQPRRLPSFLTPEESERLMLAPLQFGHPKVRDRDLAILEILYGAALRESECVDLDLDLGQLKFDATRRDVAIFIKHGKGDQPGWVPCGPVVFDALETYLPQREKLLKGKPCAALFVTTRGKRMTRGLMWSMVSHYGKLVGVKAYPHILRHSCATDMHAAGADLRAIQGHLRHMDLNSTVLYTHLNLPKMRALAARFHPRYSHRSAAAAPQVPALPPPPSEMPPAVRDYISSLFTLLAGAIQGGPAAALQAA